MIFWPSIFILLDLVFFSTGIIGGAATSASDIDLGDAAGSVFSGLIGGTSGIGLIADVGVATYKAELDLLESDGESTTITKPKIFLNNGWENWIDIYPNFDGFSDGEWGIRAKVEFQSPNVTYNIYRNNTIFFIFCSTIFSLSINLLPKK